MNCIISDRANSAVSGPEKNTFFKFTLFLLWQICFHFFLTLNMSERQIIEEKTPYNSQMG